MTFLALIIALALLFAWGSGEPLQEDKWFERWRAQLAYWDLPDALGLAIVVLAPVLVVQLLLESLHQVAFGLLWIAFAVIVLVYSLGRGDFEQSQQIYRQRCRSGDFEGAYLAGHFDQRADQDIPSTAQEVHHLAQIEFLYDAYQRFFAVLFYFLLLGPAGALAYRLLQLSQEDEESAARRCLALIDWLPARLLAATFALIGDFVRSSETLLQQGGSDTGEVLFAVGQAALSPLPPLEDHGEWAARHNEAFAQLLKRSAGAWLVLISLVVVFL